MKLSKLLMLLPLFLLLVGCRTRRPTFIVEPAAKSVSDTQYIYWGK